MIHYFFSGQTLYPILLLEDMLFLVINILCLTCNVVYIIFKQCIIKLRGSGLLIEKTNVCSLKVASRTKYKLTFLETITQAHTGRFCDLLRQIIAPINSNKHATGELSNCLWLTSNGYMSNAAIS